MIEKKIDKYQPQVYCSIFWTVKDPRANQIYKCPSSCVIGLSPFTWVPGFTSPFIHDFSTFKKSYLLWICLCVYLFIRGVCVHATFGAFSASYSFFLLFPFPTAFFSIVFSLFFLIYIFLLFLNSLPTLFHWKVVIMTWIYQTNVIKFIK